MGNLTEDPPAQDDYAIYEKVASNAGGNIFFAFLAAGFIWLITKVSMGLAKGLFWLAAAIMALDVLQVTFLTITGILLVGRTSKWMRASHAVRLLETVLCLIALWVSARVVGYWPRAASPSPVQAKGIYLILELQNAAKVDQYTVFNPEESTVDACKALEPQKIAGILAAAPANVPKNSKILRWRCSTVPPERGG